MMTPAQQLGERHRRWLEDREVDACKPLTWIAYKNMLALAAWRRRYEQALMEGRIDNETRH